MSCVLTCQLHPHQAAIVPDQLTNAVPEQEDGVAQQLQSAMEPVRTLWERGEEEESSASARGDYFWRDQMIEYSQSSETGERMLEISDLHSSKKQTVALN